MMHSDLLFHAFDFEFELTLVITGQIHVVEEYLLHTFLFFFQIFVSFFRSVEML